jgi:hypothetical protein
MVKFRQPIRPGQHGRDVKAVKDGLKRMKVKVTRLASRS